VQHSAELDALRAENAALRHRLSVSDAAVASLRGAAAAATAAGRLTDELAALRAAGQEATTAAAQELRLLQAQATALRADVHDSEQRCESLVAALDVAAAEAEAARGAAAAAEAEAVDSKAAAAAANATLHSERKRFEDALAASKEQLASLKTQLTATQSELASTQGELARLKQGMAASDTLFTAALERALELALDRAMADVHAQLADAKRAADAAKAESAGLRAQLAAAAATAMHATASSQLAATASSTPAWAAAMSAGPGATPSWMTQHQTPAAAGAAVSSAARHASAMSDAVAAAHATTARLNAAAERLRKWGVPVGSDGTSAGAAAVGQPPSAQPSSSSWSTNSTPRDSDRAWAKSFLGGAGTQ